MWKQRTLFKANLRYVLVILVIFSFLLVFTSCTNEQNDKTSSKKEVKEKSQDMTPEKKADSQTESMAAKTPEAENVNQTTSKTTGTLDLTEFYKKNAANLPDVISMNTKAYTEHQKATVMFDHKKHVVDYHLNCGQCHHDDKGQPMEITDSFDKYKSCIECHKIPGERPKGKDAPALSKTERLRYHAEALHYQCKDCHKAYNNKNNTKSAPLSCTKCHLKK